MIIMYTFIGPLPFIPIVPNKTLIQAMVGLFGLGYAFVKVSSFVRSQNAAIKKGFNDDMETNSFISGWYTSKSFFSSFFSSNCGLLTSFLHIVFIGSNVLCQNIFHIPLSQWCSIINWQHNQIGIKKRKHKFIFPCKVSGQHLFSLVILLVQRLLDFWLKSMDFVGLHSYFCS